MKEYNISMLKNPLSSITRKSILYLVFAFLCFSFVPIFYILYSVPKISEAIFLLKDLSSKPPLDFNKQNFLSIFHQLKGIALSFCMTQSLHYIGGSFFSKALSSANKEIKSFLFKEVQKMPMAFFHKNGAGEIERNISSYSESFCKIMEVFFYYIAPNSVAVFVVIFQSIRSMDFFFYITWLTLFCIISYFFLSKLVTVDEKLFFSKQKNTSFLVDLYSNIFMEKAFQIQNNTYLKFLYFQEREEEMYQTSIFKNNKQKAVMGLISNFVFIGYVIFVIFFTKNRNNLILKYNTAWQFNLSLWRTVAAFLPLFSHLGTFTKSKAFFKFPQEEVKNGLISDPHKIEIKNLFYKIDEKIIFKKFNLTINHEVVVIKGFSGSGKSSLLSLLTGISPCHPGMIFIDGKDVVDLNVENLLKKVNFLTQKSYILNDSIKNNIIIANLNFSEEQLEYSIAKSRVIDFTFGNVHELNRICGPNGSMISGGQAKRIALARLLIRDQDNTLLLLDEPFAHLDTELIAFFKNLLIEFKNQKRSIIIIDHTDNCDVFADKIVYLDSEENSDI